MFPNRSIYYLLCALKPGLPISAVFASIFLAAGYDFCRPAQQRVCVVYMPRQQISQNEMRFERRMANGIRFLNIPCINICILYLYIYNVERI